MKFGNSLLGTSAMAAANIVRLVIQVAILPVIGRILGPHAYGQIALVTPFIIFSMVIAESGLGACIVRAENLTKELEGTVFCFSGIFSCIIVAIFALLAYPLGQILHEPSFPYLLIGMSSILLLASVNIVPAALVLRAKKYPWIALSDIVSTLGGVGAITVGILFDWGVWSLVAQQIVFWICKAGVVIIGSKWRPHFILKRKLIRENIKFGANLTGATLFAFAARNIDNILIGAIMGSEILGYYALAFQVVGLPQMVLSSSVYYTIFTKASEAHREGKSSAKQFIKVLRGALLICTPAMAGLAATASLSVPLILGEKWMPAITLLILLSPFGFCQAIGAATFGIILGSGRADITFKLSLISSLVTILAILVGVMFNSDAVAIGVSLSAVFGSFLAFRAVKTECGVSLKDVGKAALAPVVSSALMSGLVLLTKQSLPDDISLLMKLIATIAVGILSYVFILFILFRDHALEDFAEIKAAFQKRKERTA